MDLDELVFHPWSAQGPRNVPNFVGGSGSHVIDADGRRYLDFSSQLVFTSLGHQHPRIVAAIKEQAGRLCALAPAHASDVRGKAARSIIELVALSTMARKRAVRRAAPTAPLGLFSKSTWLNPKAAACSYSSVRPGSNWRGSGWAICTGNCSVIAGSAVFSCRSKKTVTAVTAPATATLAIPIATTFT
jgi:hypothetical protein